MTTDGTPLRRAFARRSVGDRICTAILGNERIVRASDDMRITNETLFRHTELTVWNDRPTIELDPSRYDR